MRDHKVNELLSQISNKVNGEDIGCKDREMEGTGGKGG